MNTMIQNNETIDEHDLFLESSLEDADTSFLSEPDNSPLSCNIDYSNGSPLNEDDFHVAHYNVNSITKTPLIQPMPLKDLGKT